LSFDGTGVKVPTENYNNGDGFLVPMENCRIIDGVYYAGSPHQKMLSHPITLFDKLGRVNDSVLGLKKAY